MRGAQRAHSKLQKPPHVPAPRSGAAAAATNTEWQERTGSRRAACVQFEPPKAARPPGQRTGGFCQLVRAVRPHSEEDRRVALQEQFKTARQILWLKANHHRTIKADRRPSLGRQAQKIPTSRSGISAASTAVLGNTRTRRREYLPCPAGSNREFVQNKQTNA